MGIGDRQPPELSRCELRALFALGERIPWQYRLVLWLAWLDVEIHLGANDCGLSSDACLVDETCCRQIQKDVPRTRPGNLIDAQRDSLGRVLCAYALQTPSTGYCQGINFVVAVELLVGFTEAQALWGLASLVDKFCKGYYDETMASLL